MKILFLSAWYPNRYDPMPGLFVKQHAEAVSRNHSIAVLYVHACDVSKTEIVHHVENNVHTITVYYPLVKKFPGKPLLKAIQFIKAHYLGYKSIKRTFGIPDLVHANILTRVGVIALLLKYFFSIPYVITEHWSRYLPARNSYKGAIRKLITNLVVKKSEGIVTVSEALKNAMIQQGINHKHFHVIPNSVDISVFKPGNRPLDSAKKVFSHISCFDDSAKNISGIVRVVNALRKERNDFELHLIGDGPDRQLIEHLSDSLGLSNKYVFFDGLKEGTELVEAYQKSIFTVLFSNYENMPVVVAESFACGVPVIATNVGGLPEVINKNNGLLVNPSDEENLLQSLNFMLDNYSSFQTNEIRNFAIEKFSTGVFASMYEKIYDYIYRSKTKML